MISDCKRTRSALLVTLATQTINEFAGHIVKATPSKRAEHLQLVEYVRSTLGPDVASAEAKLIKEEEARLEAKVRQYFTNETILKAMILHAFAKREDHPGMSTVSNTSVAVDANGKKKKQEKKKENTPYRIWANLHNNLRTKIDKVLESILLTLKGDIQNKQNCLRDVTLDLPTSKVVSGDASSGEVESLVDEDDETQPNNTMSSARSTSDDDDTSRTTTSTTSTAAVVQQQHNSSSSATDTEEHNDAVQSRTVGLKRSGVVICDFKNPHEQAIAKRFKVVESQCKYFLYTIWLTLL